MRRDWHRQKRRNAEVIVIIETGRLLEFSARHDFKQYARGYLVSVTLSDFIPAALKQLLGCLNYRGGDVESASSTMNGSWATPSAPIRRCRITSPVSLARLEVQPPVAANTTWFHVEHRYKTDRSHAPWRMNHRAGRDARSSGAAIRESTEFSLDKSMT